MERILKNPNIHLWLLSVVSLGYSLFVSWAFLSENIIYEAISILLPAAITVFLLILFMPAWTLWAIIFIFPLSININNLSGGLGISVPGEMMMWLLTLLLVIRMLQYNWIPRKFFLHPFSLLLMVQVFWVFITTMTSKYSEFSVKLLVARIIFVLFFFYFIGSLGRNLNNIKKFMFLYAGGMLYVLLVSLYRMAGYSFNQYYSPAMSAPWYTDHTVFGACIGMLIPFFGMCFLNLKKIGAGKWLSFFITLTFFILLAAGVFSYSRATWLSLAVAFLLWILLLLKGKLIHFLAIAGVIAMLVYSNADKLFGGRPDEVENKETSILFHASTITDLQTDESNLERLNRWSCAWRMFLDRPLTGFGPGTYETVYGDYQIGSEKTRISVNDGTLGDAHSEYFTALSEQGLPGFILFVLWVLSILNLGIRAYHRAATPEVKVLACGLTLGIFTFIIHAFVNDFIDIEKAACLIFGMSGMILALNIWHLKKPARPLDQHSSSFS